MAITKVNDGGPAFPYHVDVSAVNVKDHAGLSLRDYFAAKAMQGLITAPDWTFSRHDESNDEVSIGVIAAEAYDIADAMLRAREEAR